jgi:hypothetical protein
MKKLIFTLAVVLTGVATVNAQNTDTAKTKWGHKHEIAGAAQIQTTYRPYNLNGLNSSLTGAGISPVLRNDIWIDLSMSHINKKWLIEDGIGFTPFSESEYNGIKTRFNQYQAFIRLGYDVAKSSDFRLYPFAGLNLTAAVLNIQDNNREQNVTGFSQELLNSTSSKTLYQKNFGIELGAGFDYLIKLKSKKTDCFEIERNIPIGFRAGYYINTYTSNWKINNYNLNNGPNNKQSAVFITLNVGLGYKIKKNL